MTTSLIAKKSNARAWQTHDAAGWLGLAAAPTFALMAWITASDPSQTMMCSSAPGMLPIGGTALMYLLMSLFHLPPWLKLVSSRPRQLPNP